MDIKDFKFDASPIEVSAVLMMISSQLEPTGLQGLMAVGTMLDVTKIDRKVLKDSTFVIDKVIMPKAHKAIKDMKEEPCVHTILEIIKLSISDTVFDIKSLHNGLVDFNIYSTP